MILSFVGSVLLALPIIAFFTLAERKVIASVQRRKCTENLLSWFVWMGCAGTAYTALNSSLKSVIDWCNRGLRSTNPKTISIMNFIGIVSPEAEQTWHYKFVHFVLAYQWYFLILCGVLISLVFYRVVKLWAGLYSQNLVGVYIKNRAISIVEMGFNPFRALAIALALPILSLGMRGDLSMVDGFVFSVLCIYGMIGGNAFGHPAMQPGDQYGRYIVLGLEYSTVLILLLYFGWPKDGLFGAIFGTAMCMQATTIGSNSPLPSVSGARPIYNNRVLQSLSDAIGFHKQRVSPGHRSAAEAVTDFSGPHLIKPYGKGLARQPVEATGAAFVASYMVVRKGVAGFCDSTGLCLKYGPFATAKKALSGVDNDPSGKIKLVSEKSYETIIGRKSTKVTVEGFHADNPDALKIIGKQGLETLNQAGLLNKRSPVLFLTVEGLKLLAAGTLVSHSNAIAEAAKDLVDVKLPVTDTAIDTNHKASMEVVTAATNVNNTHSKKV